MSLEYVIFGYLKGEFCSVKVVISGKYKNLNKIAKI